MRYYIIDVKGTVHADTDSREKAEALLSEILAQNPEYKDLELEIIEEMKRYRIKPEHLDEWGEDVTEDYIVTEEELAYLARQWEKPVEELLEDLEEIEEE